MAKRLSGRFVLRVASELHAAAKRRAVQLDISLNELCLRALNAYLTEEPSAKAAVRHAEADLAHRVQEHLGDSLMGLILFGSMARGEARDGSDIDLLIVVRRELALSRLLYSQWDSTFTNDRLSPHFVHLPLTLSQAGSIWFEVAIDGVLLFEKVKDISNLLAEIRRAMAAGRLVRKKAHGQPYWVREEGNPAHVQ